MKKNYCILLFGLALFALCLPLVARITFFQNDDWVYYEMVSRFMRGDFALHWYTGPTFYTQGIIAAGFALLFGLDRLPILTLFFSVTNFVLFAYYINIVLKKSTLISIAFGLLMFLNPISMYSSLGFMTEHYFLFFLLTSMWAIHFYEKTANKKYFILLAFLVFLGLLVRQVSLFIPLALVMYFGFKKKLKPAAWSLALFAGLYLYYSKFFPLTPRIKEVPLQFHHLADFDYLYALVYGTMLVLVAYLLPLVVSSINFKDLLKSRPVKLAAFAVVTVSIFVGLNYIFQPQAISWGEFPYFENTVERTGFYPRGISGTKYMFKGNYDLYLFWDLSAKIVLSAFISYIVFFKRKLFDLYFFLIFVYLGMLILTETFYDRYILLLVPLVILFLVKNFYISSFFSKSALIGFILFLGILNYQFALDFVSANEYVWERAEALVNSENIAPEQVQGTNAWKLTYRNSSRNYLYNFSYDSPEVNEDYKNLYDLVETKDLTFPGSLWVNPKIYLYRLKAN